MLRKPIIGITVAHVSEELNTFPRAYYVESIRKAGGQPILLPPVKTSEDAGEILALVDGLVLTGGGDITPSLLKELPLRGIGTCIPERDISEFLIAEKALASDLPTLGICRGIQLLAVAAGGKIYQDLPSQHSEAMQHKQTAPREYVWHEVKLLDSNLKDFIREERISVNSLHHQAVSTLPEGFKVNAVARDGVVEGIEKVGARFCIGVQWHPEALVTEVHSQRLFESFVQSCGK